MVNAFLEALQDDDQRRALEYLCVPDTIEEAAMQAVHYHEAARRPTHVDDAFGYERMGQVAHSENTSSDPYQHPYHGASADYINGVDNGGYIAC